MWGGYSRTVKGNEMKTIILLLMTALLACSQIPVNLRPPPPPPQAQVPKAVIERLHLDTATATRDGSATVRPITITGNSVSFALSKQPAPDQVIEVSMGLVTQKAIPDASQTPANQRMLIITLPDGPYTATTDVPVISYLTLEP